ncbi:MAG: AraC family transcriptional regulator [Kiritimatiellales bacterium]|jgi:AraC-like DNA-binding protein
MKKTAYAHYTDRYCEHIKCLPGPGKKMLEAYRAVREAKMDIQNVVSEYHSIVIPIAGRADFTQCNQTIPLQHGTVAIRWPHKPYSLVKTDDNTLEMFVFYFTADVQPLWNRLFSKNCIGFYLFNKTEVIELTKSFFDLAINVPKEQTMDICDFFTNFLLESLSLNRCRDSGPQSDPRLLRCVQYMEEQFQNIQNAEEVARHFSISRGTLYNLFKGSSYRSPKKYLLRLRINAATALLAHTGWALQEIAEELGYENADTFSKAFKKATGTAPRFYRKQS